MAKYEPIQLAGTMGIVTRVVKLSALPKGYVVREKLGLVTHDALDGQVMRRTLKPLVFGVSGPLLGTQAVRTLIAYDNYGGSVTRSTFAERRGKR